MKAVAVFPAERRVDVIEHPEPRIDSPAAVRLRMLEVGVCGTDREITSFQYGTPPPGSPYLVLGHESLGEVVEVGSAVTRVRVGDLVVPMVRRPCSHAECPACRAGRQDFCVTGDFTERGISRAHGFMTQWVVDDERYMNPVPSSLREVAVLVEPLTIAEKALIQVGEVQDRLPYEMRHSAGEDDGRIHRAVVLGAGPVGLLGAMALRVAGYDVWVYSRGLDSLGRGDLIGAIGAIAVDAATVAVEDLARQVQGIDLIYEAAGASSLAFDAMTVLGVNGIFVFTGVPGRKGPIAIDTDLIMRRLVLENQVVLGTVNAGRDAFEAAIGDLDRFVQRWPQAVRGLVTGRFPMESSLDAVLGKVNGIKSVVTIA